MTEHTWPKASAELAPDATEREPAQPEVKRTTQPGWLRSAWAPALVVLAFYGAWLFLCFAGGHQARDFIWIGRDFVEQSHASAVITYDPTYSGYAPNGRGYDGQFCYYIALDPVNARYYLDSPPYPVDYRYTRILYPMLARVLAIGQANLIPYTLLLVNCLAVAGGTLAVAAWLRRKGLSPWLALIYGLFPGLFLAVWRDLTEPVAYALVALAVYFFDFGGRRRIVWAGLAFALAGLTREISLVFAGLYGLSLLLPISRMSSWRMASWRAWLAAKGRPAAVLLSLAFAPFAAYKLFLWVWLGTLGTPAQVLPTLIPLQGIFAFWPWDGGHQILVEMVVVPGLFCVGMALWALWKRAWGVEIWALLLNAVLFVVLLAPASYADLYGSPRVSTGAVLAALLALPTLERVSKWLRPVFVLTSGAWLFTLPIWVFGSLALWSAH